MDDTNNGESFQFPLLGSLVLECLLLELHLYPFNSLYWVRLKLLSAPIHSTSVFQFPLLGSGGVDGVAVLGDRTLSIPSIGFTNVYSSSATANTYTLSIPSIGFLFRFHFFIFCFLHCFQFPLLGSFLNSRSE